MLSEVSSFASATDLAYMYMNVCFGSFVCACVLCVFCVFCVCFAPLVLRSTRLVSLAAQKFIADIAHEALQQVECVLLLECVLRSTRHSA